MLRIIEYISYYVLQTILYIHIVCVCDIHTHTQLIYTHSIFNPLSREMKVAQTQPSLKWSITQRDIAAETGYHQVRCKYNTQIFQLNWSVMNNVTRAGYTKEDWKQPAILLQQSPDRPSLAKIAQRRYCSCPLVCRWNYCHNNPSNIDIFTGDSNKSVFAATTNTESRLPESSAVAR